jgi:hypothetical protein
MLKMELRRRAGDKKIRSISWRGKEVNEMQWEIVVALVIAIPIILFPAAFVWYLNLGGLYAAIKEALARKKAGEKVPGETLEVK